MTSLGGQFSARRPGDSPFTVRTEGMLVGKGESERVAGVGRSEEREAFEPNAARGFLGLCLGRLATSLVAV